MATKIKGTVTRVMTNPVPNFFIKPEDEVALRHIDVDGHRVGEGELSAACLSAVRPKFKAWTSSLPKVGDDVELELVKDPE